MMIKVGDKQFINLNNVVSMSIQPAGENIDGTAGSVTNGVMVIIFEFASGNSISSDMRYASRAIACGEINSWIDKYNNPLVVAHE